METVQSYGRSSSSFGRSIGAGILTLLLFAGVGYLVYTSLFGA